MPQVIARFVALRLLVSVPVVLGILFVTFMLIRIGKQDPVAMLAGPLADASTYQMIRSELELDRPLAIVAAAKRGPDIHTLQFTKLATQKLDAAASRRRPVNP